MDTSNGPAFENDFEILADETRVRILQALVERLREHPDDPTLGFADLRRAVDAQDSGNFNYHLNQLEGRFIRKSDTEYRINPTGIKVVAALITGVYGEGEQLGPVEIGDECPLCEESLVATYENSILRVTCENDHVFRNTFPPGAIDQRTMQEVVELLTLTTRQHTELAINSICPFCQAQLEWSIDPEQETPVTAVQNQCSRCGVGINIPVVACLLHHPAVISFYHEHEIDIRNRPLWAPEFFDPAQVSLSTDPVRIEVSLELNEEELSAVLDEELSILEVNTS